MLLSTRAPFLRPVCVVAVVALSLLCSCCCCCFVCCVLYSRPVDDDLSLARGPIFQHSGHYVIEEETANKGHRAKKKMADDEDGKKKAEAK